MIVNFKKTHRAFTLIELLIYSVLFVVAGGLVTGITLNIKKNTDINQAQKTVDSAYIDLERRLKAAVDNATAIASVNDGLSLSVSDSDYNLVFLLSNNAVSYSEGGAVAEAITGTEVKVDTLNFKITPPQSVGIDPINHFAYNDIFGWLDFEGSGRGITIPTGVGDLNGVAWGKGFGYVFLNCLATDNCSTSNYKVSVDKNGNLSGDAWSESIGWISFCGNNGGTDGCDDTNNPNISYGVTITPNTGEFTGQAWSEGAGYISFNCVTGSADGATNICSTSNYKVQDLRRKTTAVTADIKISYNVAPYQNIFRSGSSTFNLKQFSRVTVTSIAPTTGTGLATIDTIHGSYFKTGAIVKLVRSGYKDVYPTTSFTFNSSTTLSNGVFNLTNVEPGLWDVKVINSDGQLGYLNSGFAVTVLPPTTTGTTVTTTTTTTTSTTTTTTTTVPTTTTTTIYVNKCPIGGGSCVMQEVCLQAGGSCHAETLCNGFSCCCTGYEAM